MISCEKVDHLECLYINVGVDTSSHSTIKDGELDHGECKILRGHEDIGKFYTIRNINEAFLTSGESILAISNAIVENGIISISEYNTVQVKRLRDGEYNDVHVTSTYSFEGTKSVFVIRVITADGNETTASMADLQKYIFGTGDDPGAVNLKSQFAACSHDKLMFEPFEGATSSGQTVIGGVGEVTITNITDEDATRIQKDVEIEANEKYGDLESQFDYVILCLPFGVTVAGHTEWIGYAFVKSWLSVFNDAWCTSPSALLHELGHNLGMEHSDPDYGDESCMMGFSYNDTDGPKMCFNGAKSWQLGWYSDGHLTMREPDLIVGETHEIKLVGVIDTPNLPTDGSMHSILYIADNFDAYHYYVAFNRAIGPNSETKQGADKVMVTRRFDNGDLPSDSFLLAELDTINGTYTIFNERNKTSVLVWVQDINLFASPAYATIHILKIKDMCFSDSFCDDFNECTRDYCLVSNSTTGGALPGQGVCVNERLECKDCGSTFIIDVNTNAHPEQASWSVFNIDTGIETGFGGKYTEQHKTYRDVFCVQFANFDFNFGFDPAVTDPPEYWLQMQGNLFYNTTNNQVANNIAASAASNTVASVETNTQFAVFCTQSECKDWDGCTLDNFDSKTRLCLYEPLEECNKCQLVEVNITLDDYPDQTTWEIRELHNTKQAALLASGGPYPSTGRRKAPSRVTRNRRSLHALELSEFEGYTRGLADDFVYEYPDDYWAECLEYSAYMFAIYDSFGDGICCDTGLGNYTVHVDGELKFFGGQFAHRERNGFSTKFCNYNTQNNMELYIQLDNKPEDIRWKLYKNGISTTSRAGSGYDGQLDGFIGFSWCLAISGMNFRIWDDSGDGLCCGSGIGNYVLRANNKEIKRSGEFGGFERTNFALVKKNRRLETRKQRSFKEIDLEYDRNSVLLSDENIFEYGSNEIPGIIHNNDIQNHRKLASCTTLQPLPTDAPTYTPTTRPSLSLVPSSTPSNLPSISSAPSGIPSNIPSEIPSLKPSSFPSGNPSASPSDLPSLYPSISPSDSPSKGPIILPSSSPSANPSAYPSKGPTILPSSSPSAYPSAYPSKGPTILPSSSPSANPSEYPSLAPSHSPSKSPSISSPPSLLPSESPSSSPSLNPSENPSDSPSFIPSTTPSASPSNSPSDSPSVSPSDEPTLSPSTYPSNYPSALPSNYPSSTPSIYPTSLPSASPSNIPSDSPLRIVIPSYSPSLKPSKSPSKVPSNIPSFSPIALPSDSPSLLPSSVPSASPSLSPSEEPSLHPSDNPSKIPTSSNPPSLVPSEYPSTAPSKTPSYNPTTFPSNKPSLIPSYLPTIFPTNTPTTSPTLNPTSSPTSSLHPSRSTFPSIFPTETSKPTTTLKPTSKPSASPQPTISLSPTTSPSTSQPTGVQLNFGSPSPTLKKTMTNSIITTQPTAQDTIQPTAQDTIQPTAQDTIHPTAQDTIQATNLSTINPKSPSSSPTSLNCPTPHINECNKFCTGSKNNVSCLNDCNFPIDKSCKKESNTVCPSAHVQKCDQYCKGSKNNSLCKKDCNFPVKKSCSKECPSTHVQKCDQKCTKSKNNSLCKKDCNFPVKKSCKKDCPVKHLKKCSKSCGISKSKKACTKDCAYPIKKNCGPDSCPNKHIKKCNTFCNGQKNNLACLSDCEYPVKEICCDPKSSSNMRNCA